MRSDPSAYTLLAPGNLTAVLELLAEQPRQWLPIAGGTDVMVQYAAGGLSSRSLVSLWNLPELRWISVSDTELRIGAATTYTDIRGHGVVRAEFPLLATTASWTGGIANQNRGTLGGNIVNASPAADSLPALRVYDAELVLASVRGERRVPYGSFHVGYRKTILASDELVTTVCLPRRFAAYFSYCRKVGPRNAQAISKVCMAALARTKNGTVEDVRIALGSVAPVPLRMSRTENTIKEHTLDGAMLQRASATAMDEVQPIDDIRSTVAYRRAVSGSLVKEFLTKLAGSQKNS